MPGTPTVQHRPHGRLIHPQEISVRLQVAGQRHDGANIQVPIRPSVEPVTNTRCKGIVHRRMAKGALNPDASQGSLRVQFEQRKGRRGIIQIHLSFIRSASFRTTASNPGDDAPFFCVCAETARA
jgi:hypothetical protein